MYVKYVDNTVWNTVPTDENGDGSATLPDGTEIEISDADKSKGQFVIDAITEKEALDWIDGVTDGKVKNPQAYHIYYLDDNGNLINADGSPYYVLGEKVSGTTPSEPGDSPQTGDNSNLMLWIALLFISGGACAAGCPVEAISE